MRWLLFPFLFLLLPSTLLYANSSDPWWNAAWHYRAELNINTAVVNQTGKIDIDFAALGLPSALDENSIRIVKSDGITLLTKQEFTDILYSNATDGLNNNRGEVKFIIEDAGTVRYYVYYDTTANGTKAALASSYVINGNFEHSAGSTPTGWTTGQANIGTRQPNNEVHPTGGEGTTVSVTDTGGTGQTRNANNVPHTGNAFHIHGFRDRQESGNSAEQTWIEKTFTVSSSSAGNMTYWLRVQGWDSASYDNIRVIINGTTINQNNLNISNGAISVNTTRYGESSGYATYADSGWTQASLSLSSYTGQTITVRIMHQTATDNGWKFWQLIDDMEWSIKLVSLGGQEELIDLPGTITTCTKIQKIGLSTYDTTGYNSYPNNASQYQTLINSYATTSHLFGSGYLNNITVSSGSNNNPYGADEHYLALFKGYIYLPSTGIYKFGIDGDDAVEVYIDDTLITGWYGGHGRANHARYIKYVNTTAGYHKIEYHMQERTGGDSYYLYWQPPSGNSIVIVPASQFFHCIPSISKISCVTDDPVNSTSNPKRIPGATIRYAIEVKNDTDNAIDSTRVNDSIDSNFDTTTIRNLQIQNGICDCTGTASASNNGPNGTGNGVNPIVLDFGTINANSTKCGYFEVDIE